MSCLSAGTDMNWRSIKHKSNGSESGEGAHREAFPRLLVLDHKHSFRVLWTLEKRQNMAWRGSDVEEKPAEHKTVRNLFGSYEKEKWDDIEIWGLSEDFIDLRVARGRWSAGNLSYIRIIWKVETQCTYLRSSVYYSSVVFVNRENLSWHKVIVEKFWEGEEAGHDDVWWSVFL